MRDIPYSELRTDGSQLWAIWDTIDRRWVSKPYASSSRARRRVDRLDNEYGAYRYSARPVVLA